jgi:hypothetical protein
MSEVGAGTVCPVVSQPAIKEGGMACGRGAPTQLSTCPESRAEHGAALIILTAYRSCPRNYPNLARNV